jgi:hypothetical protein
MGEEGSLLPAEKFVITIEGMSGSDTGSAEHSSRTRSFGAR